MVIEKWLLPSLITGPWKARLTAAIAVEGGGTMYERAFSAGGDRGTRAIFFRNPSALWQQQNFGDSSLPAPLPPLHLPPKRVWLVLGYLAFKIEFVIFYVLGFCHFFGKRNKDGVNSYSSEKIKEVLAVGDTDKNYASG